MADREVRVHLEVLPQGAPQARTVGGRVGGLGRVLGSLFPPRAAGAEMSPARAAHRRSG